MKEWFSVLCCVLVWACAGRALGAEPAGPGVQGAPAPDYAALYARCAPAAVMVTAVETVPRGLVNRTMDLLDPIPLIAIPGNVIRFIVYPLAVLLDGPLKAGGSGVIIDEEGHFITNHHVIEGRDVFWAELNDRRLVRARLVGSDKEEDFALLKLELKPGEKVTAAKIGDSDALGPGQAVFAIGSPLRLRQTLTRGIVSAVERRDYGAFQEYIQTDLTIGAGSSGGALFNTDGEVVGITTLMQAVFEETGDITMSIPINAVKNGLGQLRESGRVTRGHIGALIKDVTPRLAKKLDLRANTGACVVELETPAWLPGPAGAAGLKPGDVILKYGELKIDRAHTLARAVLNTKPGTKVVVEFQRGTIVLKREIEVDER